MDVHAAHRHRLPVWLDPGIGALQGAGEHLPDGDQVAVGEDVLDVVVAIGEGRAVLEQALLMQRAILLRHQRAMMLVVRGEERPQRLGVTIVEGGKIGFADGDCFLGGGGRTGRGGGRALLGERGDAVRAEREKSGIPIPKGTWQRIGKAAEKLGVKVPA